MGRIKTQLVRRTAAQLLARHADQLGEDFTTNKAVVNRFAQVSSAKLRNTIAGYLTRLVRLRKAKGI